MDEERRSISGLIADLVGGRFFEGTVTWRNGTIESVRPEPVGERQLICPGLVDAHVHIESSMLAPAEFGRIAVRHGTVATVSDPHEIANVCGVEGVRFMLDDGDRSPVTFCFGAPSCVPATSFETAGAALGLTEIEALFDDPRIGYLAEVMNFPGVLAGDPELMGKIELAKARGKPIDGHFPGGRGEDVRRYAAAGISTDHESFTVAEALDKLAAGMKILIREGSAAKNFDALIELLAEYPDQIMFCSDDKHPDSLTSHHIDDHVRRALALGFDPIAVLRAASLNPIRHYGLRTGLLQPGDRADFIIVDTLSDFRVRETIMAGQTVARDGISFLQPSAPPLLNNFNPRLSIPDDFAVRCSGQVRVIAVTDGELVTHEMIAPAPRSGQSDPSRDILKLTVVNRYHDAPPAVAFCHGFGLTRGALASSVAHDSHNVIGVGATDADLAAAVNAVMDHRGGIAFAEQGRVVVLPLPIAGLMSPDPGDTIARQYGELDGLAREAGSRLSAPFMTLSFAALLVIPELKLSDRGLFDGRSFSFVDLTLEKQTRH